MNIIQARDIINSNNANLLPEAIKVMNEIGTLSDLPILLPLIQHKNQAVKSLISHTVASIIRSRLVEHFNEHEPAMRQKLGSLMESLHPSVVKELSNDIFSKSPEYRLKAVQILGLLKKNPEIKKLLTRLIPDRDAKIRATAVQLLGKMVSQHDQGTIVALLTDKDKRVRANTVEALESLGNARMIPILRRFRKDPSNRIRGNVLKALFTLGMKDIENDLLAMINTNDDFMGASALWVITQTFVKNKAIEDAAGYCLLSSNEMLCSNAKNALKAINTPHSNGYLKYLDDAAITHSK